LFVEEMKFREMVVGIGVDMDILLVFPTPFPLTGPDAEETSFGEVGMHDGVHGE
jgi:hypothetical protein